MTVLRPMPVALGDLAVRQPVLLDRGPHAVAEARPVGGAGDAALAAVAAQRVDDRVLIGHTRPG